MRLVVHFLQWIPYFSKKHLPFENGLIWVGDLTFYILDILFVPELYECLFTIFSSNTNLITDHESSMVLDFFGDQVNYTHIKLNRSLSRILRSKVHAFVTFNTIHFHERISPSVFVHEVVHIWQYQNFGSVYIFRALLAQNSKAGYNYGGLEGLYHGMLSGKKFLSFNFEQQGEIFEDYYTLLNSSELLRSPLPVTCYEYYVDQVRKGL